MNSQTTPSEPMSTPKQVRVKQASSATLPALAKKDDTSAAREVLDSILWRIDAQGTSNDTAAVGLTGCLRRAGSSTIATNLALQASELQRGRVLLIDANWRLPGLAKNFDLTEQPGVFDILSGEVSPRECEPQSVSEHLDILCRGCWTEEQPMQVRAELAGEMLAELKTEYSLILVDLPSVDELHGALHLARQLDGTLLVARFEAVKQPEAQRALQRLRNDGVNVWGSILNRHREYVPSWLRKWL